MFYTIFRYIFECFHRFYNIVRFHSPTPAMIETSGIRIVIKYGPTSSIPVTVNPEWTIGKVKEIVAQRVSVDVKSLKIIFAGKELHDSLKINECDVGQHTVINAVCVRPQIKTESMPSTSLNDSATDECRPLIESVLSLQLSNEERKTLGLTDPKKVHFFVYCGSHCKSVCPGKLRVRCATCRQGTLTVLKDPNSWSDVLEPGRIPGTCQSENCPGSVAEFFFRCASHLLQSESDSAVPLNHIKNNFKEVPCLACTDTSPVILVFPCQSGHVICLECFKDYCLSRLNERHFVFNDRYGYTLPCPVGCENSLIQETHHFRLIDDEQYSRYQRFGTEEYILQSGGVLCPQPGCGQGIIPDPECRRVICPQREEQGGCGFVFCSQCLQGYHIGECIELDTENSTRNPAYTLDESTTEQAQWEKATKNTIKGTTKPCPKCRTPTEKDGGCMHMVCMRPQCGYHWCWVCQEEWTRECMGAHWFG